MGYKNGKEILPSELIQQIQQYIDGEAIYIPRREKHRKSWGEYTDTKKILYIRNMEIVNKYQNGKKVTDLAKEYNISTQGIDKILSKIKEK